MRYKFEIANADRTATAPNSELLTHHSKGFTLIEIIITIVLIGVLSTIAAVIILQGIRAYSEERTRSDVHYQARIAMERMAREIRLIRSQGADITSMINDNLRFIDVSGATVGFRYDNAAGTISRWNGATEDVLARGVTAFTFNYYKVDNTAASSADVWFVEIVMTDTQGTESLQMRTKVHPRNF
jgi:prepilin-type N-terminal cleavage/methylation domain-containing protein